MTTDFQNVPAVSGMELAAQKQADQTGVVAVEQSRAVAEAQARLVIAQSRPRNEISGRNRILAACERLSLAQCAVYSFPRGGTQVAGPSIRLAEAAARYWGNVEYGFRELGRDLEGSEVEAFAWDLETNTRVTRTFKVKHWRDTRSGGQALKSERDKYELVANMAQRRVRACILEIVPGDIIEDAVSKCEQVVAAHVRGEGKKPMVEVISNTVRKFAKYGVNEAMLEARLGHNLDVTTEHEIMGLNKIGLSMRDGMSVREDWFDMTLAGAKKAESSEPAEKPEPKKDVKDALAELRKDTIAKVEASGLPLEEVEAVVNAHCGKWTTKQCEKAIKYISANTPPEA